MKRAEKIALLTQVLTSPSAAEARRRLEQAVANGPKTLILIDDFGSCPAPSLTPADQISFFAKGGKHQMAFGEVGRYARRHGIRILVVEPVSKPPQA